MSWSGIIVNGSARPRSIADVDRDWRPPPLGSRTAVRGALAQVLRSMSWTPSGATGSEYTTLEGDSYSIELRIPEGDPVDHLGVRIVGSGDPLPVVAGLCVTLGWALIDGQDGDFVDFEGEDWKVKWREFQDWQRTALRSS